MPVYITVFSIASIDSLHFLYAAVASALYVAFSAYHSLRKLHAEQLNLAISSGNFESVHEVAIELIMLFLAECNLTP